MKEKEVVCGKAVLRNKTIDNCLIRIQGNTITQIKEISPNKIPQRLKRRIILPGFIDLHNDYFEKIIFPRPRVQLPRFNSWIYHDLLCVSSGITTSFDNIRFEHVPQKKRTIENALEHFKEYQNTHPNFICHHFIHCRCEITTEGIFQTINRIIECEYIKLISLMEHCPGIRQFKDRETFRNFYTGAYDLTNEEIEKWEIRHKEKLPQLNEVREKLSNLAIKNNIILASHDDTTIDNVKQALSLQVKISEFPTTIEAAKYAFENGLSVMMGTPNFILGKSHANNLSVVKALKKKVVNILTSDYAPYTFILALKKLEEFLPLHEASKLLSTNAAKAMGLDNKGAIEEGYIADLIAIEELNDNYFINDVWIDGVNSYSLKKFY